MLRARGRMEQSPLIGRTVRLTTKELKWKDIVSTEYTVEDPEFEAEAKELYGEGAEVLPPGVCVTAAITPGRTQIWVNKEGKVYKVVAG